MFNDSNKIEWAKALGLILTAIGLMLNAHDGYASRQLNRAIHTTDLIARYDDVGIRNAREFVTDHYDELKERSQHTELKEDDAKTLFYSYKDKELTEKDKALFVEINKNIKIVLNFYEDVGSAVESGVVIEDRVKESLGTVMIRWNEFFAKYINVVGEDWRYSAWAPFDRVAKKWSSEDKE